MPCNHAEEPVEPKPQEHSLLDIQAYITALTPASIDYPVRAYQTYLENGTTRWIPEEALPLLTGSYQRGKRIHISSAIENIDVDFQNGTQSTLSIPALLTELAGDIGEDITDIHTESEEPECDNPQFECTPEQQEAQQQSLADIQNAICNMDAEDFTFPLTIYLVQLCGGVTAYITGDSLLNEIEGPYAVIDQMVIDETTLISVLVTIQRPLFAMHFSGYQENGNIEQMRWKITNRAVKQYDFSYDPLDRVINADYGYYAVLPLVNGGLKPDLVPSDEYSVPTISYDAIGNIQSLIRNGMTPGANNCWEPNEIDNLTYNYDLIKGHLSSVFDNAPSGSRQYGFVPGSTLPKHYAYDNNGNMTTDQHKAIFNIKYNFLNLPEEINSLKVGYDATGKKWKKEGQSGITYYINGIEYQGSNLEAIYTGDGRLIAPAPGSGNSEYRAEYFHQDHLGNTRLGFCDFNNNGRVEISDDPGTPTNELEITQEQHYYPFGMNQDGNWYATINPGNKYLYNSKEFNDDWDINLYEYGARWYDPAIGRFIGVDPIAEKFPHLSVYNYASNNPASGIDLHGLQFVPAWAIDAGIWINKHVVHGGGYDYDSKQEEYNFDHKYDEGGLGPVDGNYGNQNTTEALGGFAENAATVMDIPMMAEGLTGKSPKRFNPKSSRLKNSGEATKTVYTTTDGPVDLNRPPSEGSSGGIGGTFVTEKNITEPAVLKEHMNIVPPNPFDRVVYPNTVSEIKIPASGLKPDPTDTRVGEGIWWIAPNTKGAKVTKTFNVSLGEGPDPIIKKNK